MVVFFTWIIEGLEAREIFERETNSIHPVYSKKPKPCSEIVGFPGQTAKFIFTFSILGRII